MPRTVNEILNDLNIATQEYTKQLVKVISEDNYINKRLMPKSESIDGGKHIAVPLRYGVENFGVLGEYDSISAVIGTAGASADKDILDEARYSWTHLYGDVNISEQKMSVENAGKRRLLNLVKVRTQNLADTFKDGMSDMLFAESDTGFDSLHKICATASNTVGGIDGSNSNYDGGALSLFNWNPVIVDPAGAVYYSDLVDPTSEYYIMKILRNIVGQLTIGSDKPTVILTTQVIWDAYEQVLSDLKRFGANYKADGGFDVLKFRNIDVAVDNHVQGGSLDANASTTGAMYVLNEDYIGFYHHADFKFKSTPWKRLEDKKVYRTELDWYGGMGVSRRDMQGAVVDLPVDYTSRPV